MAEDSTIEYITNIDSAKIEINSESINQANNILDENPYEDESEWKNYATEFETEEVEDHLEQSNEEIEDDKKLVQNCKDKHSYSDEKKPISISESDLITNSEPNSGDLISQSSNFEMNNSESDSDLISKLNKEILRIVQCPICDITFTGTSTTVKMHIKNVHKIYQGVEIHEKSKHSSQEQQGVEEQEILKSDTSNQFDEIVTNFDQNATNEESAPNMTKSDFQSDDVVTKFDMDETNLTNIVISCDKCDFKTTNRDTMNAHKNDAALEDDKSAQYNCGKSCGFKSCTINELKSHIEENHYGPIQDFENKIDDDDEYRHLVKNETKRKIKLAKNEEKRREKLAKKEEKRSRKLAEYEEKIWKQLAKKENKVTAVHCEICNKLFTGASCESNMKIHIRFVHKKEYEVKCDLCKKEFRNPHDLRRHVNGYHNKIKVAKCDACGKSFSEVRYLQFHKCRILKCELCDEKCTSKTALQRHINSHNAKKIQKNYDENGDSKITCKHCGRSFNYKKCFMKHLEENHIGQKNDIAEIENSQNNAKNVENNPENSESKITYYCVICEKWKKYREIFKSKDLLNAHMTKNHMETEIYKCDSCGKNFKSLIMIQKHIAKNVCNYDQEQKFLCYICDKSFKTAEKTKNHISKDHKNEMMKEF